ncbi:hypothetical protein MOE47_19150 [Bacillus atrophaeus]|uniref:hypothetical protein n=1 Tax=Bacillus atrophaeus TaxID=1452 RepID=UPI00227D99A7|nr:hypothetical protein [Bacillus atrophaeus]MCY8466772.1 hypothetical protein [Bacillus atrophaeus]MCY8479720.1 hypothetical protein [Bacillus atrophaeus]MCY8914488.1 hypothetical protein [Bacillus atrophaeus]MCY9116470.1 hypothetical protein [Bacillus atrophaeus]MEC0927521.1 hypothetical protein [Bacillus atrophaeus]
MYNWDFPLNIGRGISEGLNNAGIEEFKKAPWKYLTREAIQNSLDASDKSGRPVVVEFEKLIVSKNDLSQLKLDHLRKIFEACSRHNNPPEKAKKFFKRGIQVLDQEEISIFRISDYNTTGLTGINLPSEGNWNGLINEDGNSKKGNGAGGSFGVGKNAPFAASNLRAVFYGTSTKDEGKAFQGVSRISSHDLGEGETRGTGFFRELGTYAPIIDMNSVPVIFHRNEEVYGTDVFVLGVIDENEWKSKLIQAVIENFFVAINSGKLEVRIRKDIVITQENLPSVINQYISSEKRLFSDQYYEALVSEDALHIRIDDYVDKQLGSMGSVDIYIKEGKRYCKKLAMVRSTGMKIMHYDNFQGGINFVGVVVIGPGKLDDFLRQIEPAAHDIWNPQLHEDDPSMAKKVYNKFKNTIRAKIRELNEQETSDISDLDGLGSFLPDPDKEGSPFENPDEYRGNDLAVPEATNVKDSLSKRKKGPSVKIIDSTPRKPKSKEKEQDKKKKNKKTDTRNPRSKKARLAGIERVRAYCADADKGLYKLKVVPNSTGEGVVEIYVVGEDSGLHIEPLDKISILGEPDVNIPIIDDGKFGPVQFKKGVAKTFLINFKDSFRWSLEVKINEN